MTLTGINHTRIINEALNFKDSLSIYNKDGILYPKDINIKTIKYKFADSPGTLLKNFKNDYNEKHKNNI